MELNVLYFAHVREKVGLDAERILLSDRATVADAVSILVERYPTLRDLLPVVRIAVNGEFTDETATLTDGDELVLIPPVAGGSDFPLVRLSHEVLDANAVNRLRSLVGGSEHGAVVCFEGVVRNHARGRDVVGIDYEAYEPMALKEMQRIAAGIEAEIPGVRVAIHHRTGKLLVGDCAVVVVTSSAHRKEAFEACQEVLERLKANVPIWKHEKGPDGSEWVSDRP